MLSGFTLVQRPKSGHLCLVVGPSGVGKDSLLDGAREHFCADPKVFFPIRTITRLVNAGGEQHMSVDEATFQAQVASGEFALNWEAHGLFYGVPKTIDQRLTDGNTVVVNVSRSILDGARAGYDNISILSITTQMDILADRLRARARESEDDIRRRLARAEQMKPTGPDVIEIDNSGSLKDGIAKFIEAISSTQRMAV